MDSVALPLLAVGPTARMYLLPLLSVTELTLTPAPGYQPTTTMFRSPAFWADVYTTPTAAARARRRRGRGGVGEGAEVAGRIGGLHLIGVAVGRAHRGVGVAGGG